MKEGVKGKELNDNYTNTKMMVVIDRYFKNRGQETVVYIYRFYSTRQNKTK